MNSATEHWVRIAGFPNYEASNLGNIRHRPTGRVRKQSTHWKGYKVVGLMRDGVRSSHSVHRLIAGAFVANPESKPCVNHKNGIKADNRAENLEWVTVEENNAHAGRAGLMAHGETHFRARHSDETIKAVRVLHAEGFNTGQLAQLLGVSIGGTAKILSGRNRRERQQVSFTP